jgi:hypothetical protein
VLASSVSHKGLAAEENIKGQKGEKDDSSELTVRRINLALNDDRFCSVVIKTERNI